MSLIITLSIMLGIFLVPAFISWCWDNRRSRRRLQRRARCLAHTEELERELFPHLFPEPRARKRNWLEDGLTIAPHTMLERHRIERHEARESVLLALQRINDL